MGIAKEQARFLLPLGTQTKLYMCGSIRSWVHYLELRTGNGTQKEHKDIAMAIKAIFKEQLSDISNALEW
jgi:thymidylate synthase (FAD)